MQSQFKVVIVIVTIIFQIFLSCSPTPTTAGWISGKFVKVPRKVSVHNKPLFKLPSVGLYRKNYKGDVTKVITEVSNSEVTLPLLRFEDHTWEGHSIDLDCNASYPVQWIYKGVGAPAVHMRTHREASDFFNKNTYVYRATVVFTHTTEKQTGNYTCQSIDNNQERNLAAFLYLFVPGNGIFMSDIEESQTVVAEESKPWVTLPCSVSDSEAKVILLKKHPKNGIEVMQTGRHLTFDPKVGFQIQWQDFHEPWADYVCVGQTESSTEQLDITLVPPQHVGFPQIGTNNPSNLEGVASQGLKITSDEENLRILCCSSTNERPSMKSTGCTSVADCNLRRNYLDAKSDEENKEKIGKNCISYEMSELHDDSGILRCSLGEMSNYFIFAKQQDNLITNFTLLPEIEQILNIYVENSPKLGKLYISCHANTFFFSNGLKWAWKRPNGSLEFIQEARPPAPVFLEVDKKENIGSTLYCFAPLQTSATEWKSQSIVIK